MAMVYGGNLVKTLDIKKNEGRHYFAEAPYVYYFQKIPAASSLKVQGLRSFSVYVLPYGAAQSVQVIENGASLAPNEALQVENSDVMLVAQGGEAHVLVAGTRESHYSAASITAFSYDKIKKVDKPWGWELWISGEHKGYAFKRIFIKKGTKTSLQYHRFKQETNVLFEGEANLHYKHDSGVANNDVKPQNIATELMKSIVSIDVEPNTIHRIEAVSDIMLYEISTPHLDDVVRLSDDANRPDGRIASEHQAGK